MLFFKDRISKGLALIGGNRQLSADQALRAAAARIGGTLVGAPAFGWRGKSVGCRIYLSGGGVGWLKLRALPVGGPSATASEVGEIAAGTIAGVRKPVVTRHFDFEVEQIPCRALIMSCIDAAPVSPTPVLCDEPRLPDGWLNELRSSLQRLEGQVTARTACDQSRIAQVIESGFGVRIDDEVGDWMTCHGDLHWKNLTSPELFILDWEAWGRGPRGLDIANLLAASVLVPAVYCRIEETFADWLGGRQGLIVRLFALAKRRLLAESLPYQARLHARLEVLSQGLLRRLDAGLS